MDELEKVVDKLQSDATKKCMKKTEEARAYKEGYVQGIEDLYRYIRQSTAKRD